MCATRCYVDRVPEITHRQLRNESAEVLRRVADGETIVVTNHGRPAAVIGPPQSDPLARLAAEGGLRPARRQASRLREIPRRASRRTAAEIVDDVRGRW